MRVAIDVTAVHPTSGGVLRYIVELARHLPAVGVETVLIDQRERVKDGSGRLFHPAQGSTVEGLAPASRPARLLWEQLALPRAVDRLDGISMLHSPHYTMPRRPSRLPRALRTGVPNAVTIHDLTFFTMPEMHSPAKARMFRSAIRYAAGHADVLVCVSDRTASLLHRHADVIAPVVVAPHGIDTDRFRPPTGESRASDDAVLERFGIRPPYVLYVGTIAPHKNVGGLLQAFELLRRREGMDDLTLVIGGSAWPGAWEAIGQWATPAVKRIGFVPDEALPALYRGAEVFAYPSFEEGFGLPVLEALACGTAVLTSVNSVMSDIAGPHAVAVDPHSVGDLADGLAVCLDTGGRNSGDRVAYAHTFTWENSAALHREAYLLAVENCPDRRSGSSVRPPNGR